MLTALKPRALRTRMSREGAFAPRQACLQRSQARRYTPAHTQSGTVFAPPRALGQDGSDGVESFGRRDRSALIPAKNRIRHGVFEQP